MSHFCKGAGGNRRATLEELDRLMEHFGHILDHRPYSIPMQKIVAFALFSTRRQRKSRYCAGMIWTATVSYCGT